MSNQAIELFSISAASIEGANLNEDIQAYLKQEGQIANLSQMFSDSTHA
jgi:hypothetical protein